MQFLLFICCLWIYIFRTLIIESMIVNMINSSETHGQVATKDGHISLKKSRVFSSVAILKLILFILLFIVFYSLDQNKLKEYLFC